MSTPLLYIARAQRIGQNDEVEVDFSLSARASGPVTAEVELLGAGPVARGALFFAAGETSQRLTLPLPGQAASEALPDGMVLQVAVGSVLGADLAQAWAVVQSVDEPITVDATPVANPLIYVSDEVVGESASTTTFDVTLSAPGTGTVTVNYTLSNYTASSGSDYTATSGTLTFTAGETIKTIDVAILANSSSENLESFRITLSGASGGSIAKTVGTALIVDNDVVRATPDITVRDVFVDEQQGTATFMVTLGESVGQSSSGTVTVDYATAGGTATSGTDFTASSGTLTFAAGESLKLVTVSLTNDGTAEGNERFFLNLSNASGGQIIDAQAVATIGANDVTASTNPLISIASAVVDETDGFVDLAVTLSAPSASAVTVNWATANYTASSGSDYDGDSGSLRFDAGETLKVIRIGLGNDSSQEIIQRFFVNLSTASGGTIHIGSGEVLIIDNDTAVSTPGLFVRDVVIDEAQGTATFMVTLGESLNQSSTSTVTVDYATAGGSATSGSDYTAASGTLSFAPGESLKLVTVDITNDAVAEGAERFFLNLSNATGANIVQGQALATIGLSDGTTSTNPLLSIASAVVDETGGFVDLTVSLSAPSTSTVTVNYATANWTASAGSDYVSISGGLRFLAGETTKTVRVELDDDSSAEGIQRFFVNLSSATNATLHNATAEVLIVDNDTAAVVPDIYVRDIVIDEKQGTATFMVTLGETVNQVSTSTVTVDYTTTNGSATSGSDFTGVSGTLSFAPGESVKLVTVDITDDATAEGAERFFLNLSNATGANIVQGQALATIGLSDGTTSTNPLISITGAVVDETGGFVDLTVNLSAASASTVTVSYATSNWTASAGSDFTSISGGLRFLAGETTKTVRIDLDDDSSAETLQRFFVSLSSATNATIHNGSAEVLIVDNDTAAVVPDIYVRDIVIDEKQGTATFMVTLGETVNQISTSTVTVDYTTTSGSAASGSDFTGVSGTLSFAPGESVKLVTVDITDDATAEGAERFFLNLSNATGANIVQGQALATIGLSDGTTATNPLLSIAGAVVDETGGFVDLTVTLSAASASTVTASYATSNWTASSGSDFASISGGLRFLPGETTKTVRIDIYDDSSAEDIQRFFVSLSSATNATIHNGSAEVLIADNDSAAVVPDLYVRDLVVDEKQGTASFMVTLGENFNQSSTGTVTVDYTTTSGSAASGSDFTGVSGTLSFAPGESVKLVTVDITDDTTAEGAERFFLNLSNATGANIAQGQALATIGLSDGTVAATPLMTISNAVVDESDGFVDLTVNLSAPSASTVTVTYSTSNWTASSGSDYVGITGSLRFLPGETSKVVRIDIENDSSVEDIQRFFVGLSSATGATIENYADVAIVDNDSPVAEPQVFLRDVIVDEKQGTATFVVTLGESSGTPSAGPVSVSYATVSGTATAGSDFTAVSGTLNFAPGETVKLVTVDISDDAVAEGMEQFYLNLSNASGASLADASAVAQIAANDAANVATPTLSVVDRLVAERSDYVDVAVTLSAPSAGTVTVNYATSSNTATLGSDYDGISGSLRFNPGETVQFIRVEIYTDSSVEGNQSFFLTLSSPSGATLSDGSSLITIVDDDGGFEVFSLGLSDDAYTVDDASDVIVENLDGGTDTITSSLDYVLGAHLENLVLLSPATVGTGNELNNALTGNELANTLTGGAGDDTLDGAGGADAMTGGTGNDLYYVNNAGDTVTEATGEGTDTVRSNISYTLGSTLEHLILTGSANISGTGNAGDNQITGNGGNNAIDGGAGADAMAGGAGDDAYVVDNAADTVTEAAAGGTDSVTSSLSWVLSQNVENLTLTGTGDLTGTGNASDNQITGTSGANLLSGGDGDDALSGLGGEDVLEGGNGDDALSGGGGADALNGGAGDDAMTGGAGNDSYSVDSVGDTVIEVAAGGYDTVSSSVDHTLATEVEALVLTGSAANGTGNTLNNNLTGQDLANTLAGLGGNDKLIGNGGNDSLAGGGGDDTLTGGTGADTLNGGTGGDTLEVDNAGDVIVEAVGGGFDTVRASVNFTLAAGVEVERIDLVDGALQATGNDLGQVIAGNEANNVLSGAGGADNLKGGAGDDTLDGGSGNDILNGGGGGDRMLGGSGDDEYLVNNAFDVVVEALDAGTDIVSSSVDFVLGDHVEKLTLTGTAALGTGNVLANTLLGNASANTLEGRDGADTLTGGGGADRYVLTSTVGSDTITDFASGSDRLVVSQATLAVRNGDAVLDNATSIAAPGGFAVNAEYVVVTTNLSGAITAAKASAAIGSATSAYTVGTTRLFMVDNGTDSALYLFTSGDADAAVETAELTLLATLQGTGSTTTADLVFGP